MVFHMRNDFSQLLDVRRLQVYHVVGDNAVIEVPQVDAEVICGQEVLAVATDADGVDVVIVAIFVLLSFNALVACADYLRLRKLNFIPIDLALRLQLAVRAVLELPEFYNSVVRRNKLEGTVG